MLHWVEPRHLDIVLDLQKPEVQDLVSEGRQGTYTNKSIILGEGGGQREKWRGTKERELEGGGTKERELEGGGAEGERVGGRGDRGRESWREGGQRERELVKGVQRRVQRKEEREGKGQTDGGNKREMERGWE